MHLFTRLVLLAVAIMAGILLWDLNQEKLAYPGKKLIVFAGMFNPGEPMQQIYAGPTPAMVSRQPFGPDDLDHYDALIAAWPQHRDKIVADYRRIHDRPFPHADRVPATLADPTFEGRVRITGEAVSGGLPASTRPASQPSTTAPAESPAVALAREYRQLKPDYVARLVEALGQSDRGNRIALFNQFAESHRQFDRHLILTFERLHPAYTVGLFEDFERRHPDQKIIQRWDGRWVLSANRPRFLTGADVPDIIDGSIGELRILMRENLALPLDQPLPDAAKESWRTAGVMQGEAAYDDPGRTFEDEFYDWAIDRSRYTVTEQDVRESDNPYPAGRRVLYLIPQEIRTYVIFYNKAHFRRIGRDPNDPPKTVEEFEDVCHKLLAAGIEPISNDGMDYMNFWFEWMIYRRIGNDKFVDTVMNRPGAGRFAGAGGDPRYLEIARRLRKWRDENFWMKGFSSSQWPQARTLFSQGKATFQLTGSWLPTEIAGTMTKDTNVFELGSFFFPRFSGELASRDSNAIQITPQGHCVCRQGKNPEGAVLLLKYLIAHGSELAVQKVNTIAPVRGVPFPAAMRDIEQAMVNARNEDFLPDGPSWFAPKFNKFVLGESYPFFFLIRKDDLSPQQFVETLERKAQSFYADNEGAQ